MTYRTPGLFLIATFAHLLVADEGDPSIQHLFPVPDEARQILDQRCVFCHGEIIDGKAEIREDLDLSSEAAMRATMFDLDSMLDVIESDEMPYEAKLSHRLRRDPEMQRRLKEINEAYEANGEREKLLAWLRRKGD